MNARAGALGMPLFIPLGDLVERRRLMVTSFFIGLTTVVAQIMIPLATELALQEQIRTAGSSLRSE